jgi:endonuclease/exonuclease/phosphatase family metal-dependent hydrolase
MRTANCEQSFWRPRWFLPEVEPFQERIGGRLALVCEANVAGTTMVTYNLHLESKGDDLLRCSQIDETLDDVRRYDPNTPVVLAGDFNLDVSGGAAAAAIGRAQFLDTFANPHVPTTPHSFLEQGRTIDWIFTRGPLRANQPQVHRSVTASEHYPLSITVKFAERWSRRSPQLFPFTGVVKPARKCLPRMQFEDEIRFV